MANVSLPYPQKNVTHLRLYLAEEYILIHATFLAWIHDVQVLPTLENHDILISLLSVPAQLEKGKHKSVTIFIKNKSANHSLLNAVKLIDSTNKR